MWFQVMGTMNPWEKVEPVQFNLGTYTTKGYFNIIIV